jgi:hypothetical protein
MAIRRLVGWAVLAMTLLGPVGCCSWCEKHCGAPAPAACYQPAGTCCPAPVAPAPAQMSCTCVPKSY